MKVAAKEKGIVREGNVIRFPGTPAVRVEFPDGEWYAEVHVGHTRVRVYPRVDGPIEVDGIIDVEVWKDHLDGSVILVFRAWNTRIQFDHRHIVVRVGLDEVDIAWEEYERA